MRPAGPMATDLTDEQRAVYDRQLRVWGLETQSKCVLPASLPRAARLSHAWATP